MLQAKIDAAAESGRPLSLKLEAAYGVSAPLTLPSFINIEGNGALVQALNGNNTYVMTNADRVNGNTGIVIRDLKVDGNAAGQTAQYNTIEFMRVKHSKFYNLDVTGAKRNATFPNGTNGDGLCLIYCDYNEIIGGYFHHNTYDGIKLRSSDWNHITSVLCEENGRSGIQLAFYSPSGPPYNVGEGVEAEGSNHNTIVAPTILHSTGVPHAFAPTTSGVYLHTAWRNTVIGIQAHGVRQGIGVYGGAWDNEFNGGLIRINHVDRAAIHVEGGPAGLFRNTFRGISSVPLTGANGKHAIVTGGADGGGLNRFENCYFTNGAGTGTWTVDISSGSTDTWLANVNGTYTLADSGTRTVRHGIDHVSGKERHDTALMLMPQAGVPSNAAISNVVQLYSATNGVFGIKDYAHKVTTIGYGTMTFPDAGGSLPTADATRRGQLRWLQGGAGVADGMYVCRKKADDTYEWALL